MIKLEKEKEEVLTKLEELQKDYEDNMSMLKAQLEDINWRIYLSSSNEEIS